MLKEAQGPSGSVGTRESVQPVSVGNVNVKVDVPVWAVLVCVVTSVVAAVVSIVR